MTSDEPGGTLLLDVRADHLWALRRLVLVPMIPLARAPDYIGGLDPVFEVDGLPDAMMTQYIASVPRGTRRPTLENLARYRDEILRALDVLFTGF